MDHSAVLADVHFPFGNNQRTEHDTAKFLFYLDFACLGVDAKHGTAVVDKVDTIVNLHWRASRDSSFGNIPEKLIDGDVAGGVSIKGKDWKTGETEPEAWTIEGEDALPNTVGSPGLFGNSTDAEIYIDNVSVTAN